MRQGGQGRQGDKEENLIMPVLKTKLSDYYLLPTTHYPLPTNSYLKNYWFQTRCVLTPNPFLSLRELQPAWHSYEHVLQVLGLVTQ